MFFYITKDDTIEFSMTFGVICYLYSHFGDANSILLSKNKNILPLLAFGWKISHNLNRIVDKLPISVKICITLHA